MLSKWSETMSSVGVCGDNIEYRDKCRLRFSKLGRVSGPSHIADINCNDEFGGGYR